MEHRDHIHWADPPAQPCGAKLPPVTDAGWECNGKGLVIVLTTSRGPIVLPRRALEIIDPEPWWELPIQNFTGGDHLHLVVPRRPTAAGSDAVFMSGGSAIPFKGAGKAIETIWPTSTISGKLFSAGRKNAG